MFAIQVFVGVVSYHIRTLRIWLTRRDLSIEQAKEIVNDELINEECQGLEVALDQIKDGRPIGTSPKELRFLLNALMLQAREMAPNHLDTFQRCYRVKKEGEKLLEAKGL